MIKKITKLQAATIIADAEIEGGIENEDIRNLLIHGFASHEAPLIKMKNSDLEDMLEYILSQEFKVVKKCPQCGESDECMCGFCETCLQLEDEDGRCGCTNQNQE